MIKEKGNGDVAFIILCLIVIGLILSLFWIWPQYKVWQQGLAGEAELKRAEQNRQVKIQEAKAHSESAKFLSDAEIERARGVAEANKIIANGLGGPEGYLRYLYIDSIAGKDNQIIYIPTEAGVPVLEAGKR